MRKNELYLPGGWVNMRALINNDMPFVALCGGRGTGKTYGSLSVCIDDGIKFIYMRRLQAQVDLLMRPEFNPFKTINNDREMDITPFSVNKYIAGYYHVNTNDKGKLVPAGEPLGYMLALSTISNLRGFDMSDVDLLILDEFIPERHERPIKDEASAFFNAYETINRNRELLGRPPLKCIMLSNANDLGNPYFIELNLVMKCERMRQRGIEYLEDKKRGIGLCILQGSRISQEKSGTALYKLTSGTEFNDMAINNEFAGEERGRIGSRPLKEYTARVMVGELVIYRHKSKNEYYVCSHLTGTCKQYGTGPVDLSRFRKEHLYIWTEYIKNNIIFESYLCEILFQKYFN